MVDTLKKTLYTAIGVTMAVHANTKRITTRIFAHVKASEADGRRVVDQMKAHVDTTRYSVEKMVLSQVDHVLDRMNIVTHKDIESLEKRIDAVEVQIQADRTTV